MAVCAVEAQNLTRVFRKSQVYGYISRFGESPGLMLQNLYFKLHGQVRRIERRAVDGVTLTVPAGAFVGLLGPNGSGKSTLLKLIAGLVAPSEGSLRVLGADAATEQKALLSRTNFIPGVLTGGAWVDGSLTPRRNLRFVAELFGLSPTDAEIERVLGWLGMTEWADSRVGTLSSGTTAKLQLAFGLMRRAPIYLLDEPTEGVAPEVVAEIRRVLTDLNRQAGVTIIYATHHLLEAQDLFTHVAILGKGKLLAYGAPAELTATLGAVETVRIELSDWQPAAVAALTDLGDLRDVAIEADALTGRSAVRFLTADSRQALPLVIGAVTRHGCRIRHVDVRRPTLEDVYLRTVEGQESERGPTFSGITIP
jgi:ABC-type multidrug transport system ATPase subunit